jgi:hypothetical protein
MIMAVPELFFIPCLGRSIRVNDRAVIHPVLTHVQLLARRIGV